MRSTYLPRLSSALAVVGCSAAALACSMPLPPPEPEEPEHEIWCSALRYNRATGKNEYLMGIEVSIMPPPVTTTCMCGVNVNNVGLPASFRITQVDFVVANMLSGDMTNIADFDDFAENEAVENEIEDLKDSIENPTGFAFESDIEPFTPPELEPEDIEKMFFLVEIAPEDRTSLLGRTFQFAAGSDDPNHPLAVFTGYQTTVDFPVINICIGDPSNDGRTNFADVTSVLSNFGVETPGTVGLGDSNADGRVDFADITDVLSHYGMICD